MIITHYGVVQPKVYVSAAKPGTDSNSSATITIGAVAGVVAAAILAVGFGANVANVSAGVSSNLACLLQNSVLPLPEVTLYASIVACD